MHASVQVVLALLGANGALGEPVCGYIPVPVGLRVSLTPNTDRYCVFKLAEVRFVSLRFKAL